MTFWWEKGDLDEESISRRWVAQTCFAWTLFLTDSLESREFKKLISILVHILCAFPWFSLIFILGWAGIIRLSMFGGYQTVDIYGKFGGFPDPCWGPLLWVKAPCHPWLAVESRKPGETMRNEFRMPHFSAIPRNFITWPHRSWGPMLLKVYILECRVIAK